MLHATRVSHVFSLFTYIYIAPTYVNRNGKEHHSTKVLEIAQNHQQSTKERYELNITYSPLHTSMAGQLHAEETTVLLDASQARRKRGNNSDDGRPTTAATTSKTQGQLLRELQTIAEEIEEKGPEGLRTATTAEDATRVARDLLTSLQQVTRAIMAATIPKLDAPRLRTTTHETDSERTMPSSWC